MSTLTLKDTLMSLHPLMSTILRAHGAPTPMRTLKVGDLAWYRGAWNARPPVLCRIVGVGEKNGEPVLDYTVLGTTDQHWGYAHQFSPAKDRR